VGSLTTTGVGGISKFQNPENVKIALNGQIHHFKHMDADIATIIISRPNNPESGEVGVEEMKVKVENPQLRTNMLFYSLFPIFSFSAGIYVLLTGTFGRVVFGVFFILLGIVFFIILSSRELVFRPISIDFSDIGVVLELPMHRKQVVRWEKITSIYAIYGNPNTFLGRFSRVGGLDVFNRLRTIDLTYELAFLVRDEYFKRFGLNVNKIWRHTNKSRFG
jgi:hypothetical protein